MSATMLGGVLLGLLLGVPTGLALQTMRRARADYVGAKVGMPGLRTAYWRGLGKTVQLAGIIVILVAVMLTWLTSTSDAEGKDRTPAKAPTVSPAARR